MFLLVCEAVLVFVGMNCVLLLDLSKAFAVVLGKGVIRNASSLCNFSGSVSGETSTFSGTGQGARIYDKSVLIVEG